MRALAAGLAVLLAGCAPAASHQPADPAHPTIVSLNPCADAILAQVVEPAQLLAISHYSHDPHASSMPPEQAARYGGTGGTVEEVLALAPDVVVGDAFMAPATRAAFERLGVRVETIAMASTVSESEAQVRQLAALAGQSGRGEKLVGEIERALDETRRPGGKVSALLWQQGGIVAGPDSLVAHLLEHTGFASHAASRVLGQGAYLPLERVAADPPQVVLSAGRERALNHPVLQRLDGVAHAGISPDLLYCGGPTIPRLARRLADIRDAL